MQLSISISLHSTTVPCSSHQRHNVKMGLSGSSGIEIKKILVQGLFRTFDFSLGECWNGQQNEFRANAKFK